MSAQPPPPARPPGRKLVFIPTLSTTTGAPRENPAVEAKSADVHEAVIAELAKRLKADHARNTEHAEMPEMPAWRAAHRG
jgi:hypothetical protein